MDGTHGIGRALDVLSVYDRLGCDVIGLQETHRSGRSAFTQAGYLVHCTAAVSAVARMVGRKGKGSRTRCEDLHHACCTPTGVYQ